MGRAKEFRSLEPEPPQTEAPSFRDFGVWGFWGLEFRVWGLGFRVSGLGFRVWGLTSPLERAKVPLRLFR